MRWAATILLVACGGASAVSTSPDGGSSQTLPAADAGPQGPPDAGPPADCAGLVPVKMGAAYTFDVPTTTGQTCTASTSDGQGFMAAEAHDSNGTTWNIFATNGARWGNFNAGPIVFGQPTGFEGYSNSVDQYWTEGAEPKNFTPVDKNAVIAAGYTSGTIAIGTTAVHKVDATGNEVAQVATSLGGTPLAGAEDASGAVLAVVGVSGTAKGIWFDMTHATAGSPFTIGTGTSATARPLIGGGIAVSLDGKWTALVTPAGTQPAPSWLKDGLDFTIIRGSKAYGIVEQNAVHVVSPHGSACGQVQFLGVTSVTVGVDGTVIGSSGATGCTKVFWLGALK
jgi:hypothetical protein